MGASWWDYYVAYQPDLDAALDELRQHVFDTGDYWWAVPYQFGTSAADFPNRPRTEDELWEPERVRQSGTHSILDMDRMVADGEKPEISTVQPVSEAEALAKIGVAKLTRDHVEALKPLAEQRWFGRCAVLHNAAGEPEEIYFWGFSGD
ncbi:hypothetical protein DFJ67_0733 [Asanoa ferruginea]|uniref:Uncharacterized protein n=1 Tax=Asanoa ferruginea TaxID=53367 RepID=A0A3D9ZCZ8_9ACTN|nr:hypothetical protein [Asanoa ferruginea]REF94789.1 hypothetical protein DFJ67_0733 [Asanoa ferruginea]GIF45633.1 hypothetical protein Afe04nite_01720 [Asanoa ferruginea]